MVPSTLRGRDRNTHSGLVLEKTMNMSKLFRQEKLALGGGCGGQ